MNLLKAIRVEQWIKNLLIFSPAITANVLNKNLIIELFFVFLGFSLVVSSTYILNDLVDLEADRSHPIKKLRPIANGYLNFKSWILISFALFSCGIMLIYIFQKNALLLTSVYCLLTISYSLKLKYIKYLDITLISFLFTLRVLIGGIPFKIPLSKELVVFVFFTCLGIITGKKYSILKNKDLRNSKIKNFLLEKYRTKSLESVFYVSFIISSITYIYWIFNTKYFEINEFELIALLCSAILLIYIKYFFISKTLLHETEDIFHAIKNSKNIMFSISIFVVLVMYGVL